jgi:hypothetical protein
MKLSWNRCRQVILSDYKKMSVVQGCSHPKRRVEPNVNLEADEVDESLLGRCFSIGHLGVLVRFDPVPKFGSRVSLVISFPHTPNKSDIPCTVRWRNVQDDPSDTQFKHLHPMEVWSLNRLINQLEQSE